MADDDFKFPKNTQRVAVIGRTGSGKTQAGAWLLSHSHFDRQPYVIIDYKGDELLNSIEDVREIKITETPKKAGLYILHPQVDDEEGIENFLWNVWKKEKIGLFFDECYMINKNSSAFNAILTQGRSKRIPAIMLTQRPAWTSRFVFSEADFLSIFQLNDILDIKRVEGFLPGDIREPLPNYHSRWFDVARNKTFQLQPVPDRDTILERFETRLKAIAPKRRFF